MRLRTLVIPIAILMAVSFLSGAWVSHRTSGGGSARVGKKILHYVDPMHPSYTSDKPGIAPDCGMPLEPVYADGTRGTTGSATGAALLPGTVQLPPERQQLIGVKTGEVEKSGGEQSLRLQGRVVADELRTYVINATIDGWITESGSATTGSFVKKHEVLASFYSPEFLSATQALLFALNSTDRVKSGGAGTTLSQKGQIEQYSINLKQYRDTLNNLGMGNRQIDEIIRTRKVNENVDITSPGNGLVTVRNVSPGQRFERGKELYRIVDLSRVWVLVDTFGVEADFLKPGMRVNLSLPNRNRTYIGRVSTVPPQFDPTSRTLKARLEVDNPGMILRPDMFVDVELPVHMPAMLSVPAEALLDSGQKKTVFVEKGSGIFEPRQVQTGRSFGDRVEIVSGLKEGERIAVSGTFLLDSESRMKTASAGITGTPRLDPSCGMYVDEGKARATGHFIESGGETHFFCSDECKLKFLKKPAAKPALPARPAAASPPKSAPQPMTHDMGQMHD